LNNSTFNNLN
jgi:hypothetical protein